MSKTEGIVSWTILTVFSITFGFLGGYLRHYEAEGDIQQLQQDHDWLDTRLRATEEYVFGSEDATSMRMVVSELSDDWSTHTKQIHVLQNQVNDLQKRLADALRGPVTDDPTLPPEPGFETKGNQ